MTISAIPAIDWLALIWFLGWWLGYHIFSRKYAKTNLRLQSLLGTYVDDWARVLQQREFRVIDTGVISNLERNSTFFASSSLLIIAAVLTTMSATEQAIEVLAELPLTKVNTPDLWIFKLLILMLIYTYSFFTFSWSIRQYGMASVIMAGAPMPYEDAEAELRDQYSKSFSRTVTLAMHSFVVGLRAYYFSLALLTWFVHPVLLFVAAPWVFAVLYRRDFRSKTLKALLLSASHRKPPDGDDKLL